MDLQIDSSTNITQEPVFTISKSGRKKYKTRKNIKNAKIHERNYICECNHEKHGYFISEETNENYVEGHHIIPMEFQRMYCEDKKRKLDVAKNIIPLCPHCHKKMYHGIKSERVDVIQGLYKHNEQKLKEIYPELTFEILESYYNVYQ